MTSATVNTLQFVDLLSRTLRETIAKISRLAFAVGDSVARISLES